MTTDDAADERDELGRGALFPIVGVGASAGGLEAFTQLLEALPRDTGMGFVLVQHLDPDHESALTEILSRATSLPVREITDDERVRVNHIHVIPPDTNLTIAKGVLQLQPRKRTRTAPHRSIDTFFESLAEDQRERAVGVVLSGTANDGTMGLEAIKAEGGITFAQDHSAKYDSMPRSAVAAGCVDLVLSPVDIAKELARIAKHPYVAGQSLLTSATMPTEAEPVGAEGHRGDGAESDTAQNGYKRILLLLSSHSGVDFSLYKSKTLERRIARRLMLNKQSTLEDYAGFLRGNAKELDALYSDVLISVTSFFRNPETFDVLKHKILPELLKQRGDDPLRFWVLGCSTGQEAYSLAMAFVEAAEKAPRMRKLQVFATDLNEAMLEKARHGLYAKSLVGDITPQRLQRFFVEADGGYRVSKTLRDMVVFARQNLTADPPFSRVDLISCRNLFIYLEPSAQKKAIPTFHYALTPGGFLLLGASESIGGFTDLFEAVDKKHKIYSKKPARTSGLHLPVRKEHGEEPPGPRPPVPMPQHLGPELPEESRGELNAQREADRITVNKFAPPGVLVDAELQVLQFRGTTDAFLEPPSGKPSFGVLKMARQGLMLPLRSAISQAKKENKTARKENVRVKRNGETRTVNLEVIPLKNLRERCFLILFEEAEKASGGHEPSPPRRIRADRSPRGEKERRIAELETELSETRDYLQSIQEQLETSNEEFQASNEEVQSANEELQSSNEELETSKEELESTNEELITVNEEMSNRNSELNRLNNDLVNLQTAANVAIVLLGRDLSIRRFGLLAGKQFELLAADLGRPIGHIRNNLVLGDAPESPLDLEGLSAEVISSMREQEREVRDKGGRWYSLRVRPYMTLDNKVDGAVLVVVDIDTRKRAEEALRETHAQLRSHAEELTRFNRVAIGRELRMIELKKELDEVCRRHGEAARYPFEFAQEVGIQEGGSEEPHSKTELPRDGLVPLESILCTEELDRRPSRPPDFETENRMLAAMTQALAESPRTILQTLAESIREVFKVDSAGLSLLTKDEKSFYWPAIAGMWKPHIGGGTPRDFGPCGDVLDRNAPLLFTHFERRYAYLLPSTPPAEECLLVPFYVEGKAVGTIWAIAHDDRRKFDAEDLRQLVSLARFASAAYQAVELKQAQDSRLAALNLMEDADQSRRAMEKLNVALRESEAELSEADRRKDEFLAMLGHELRNPLSALTLGLARMGAVLDDRVRSEELRGMMVRQTTRMGSLLDELLDLARVTSGKIELSKDRTDLADVVRAAAETVMPLVERQKHKLTLSLPPDKSALVLGDAIRLTQVVENLLTNAAKYTNAGGQIALTLESRKDMARIIVRDTGTGISAEFLPHVFEVFTQAPQTLDRAKGGLGLGLPLVKRLVEMHEGQVTASSPGLGQGSEFIVTLPRLLSGGSQERAALEEGQPAPTEPGKVRPRRILVVDDEEDTAGTFADLLREDGHQTLAVGNGPAALAAIRTFGPEVVLVDLGLPEMDGYEVARRLREEQGDRKMLLIAVTGYQKDASRLKQAGFDQHLIKPPDMRKLSSFIAGWDSGSGTP